MWDALWYSNQCMQCSKKCTMGSWPYKFSDRSMEVQLTRLFRELGQTDRPTNRPTDMEGHRKVTLTIIILLTLQGRTTSMAGRWTKSLRRATTRSQTRRSMSSRTRTICPTSAESAVNRSYVKKLNKIWSATIEKTCRCCPCNGPDHEKIRKGVSEAVGYRDPPYIYKCFEKYVCSNFKFSFILFFISLKLQWS